MSRSGSPTSDDLPPQGQSTLASLRQSLSLALDGSRAPSAAAPPSLTAPAASLAGLGAASSGLVGANDGESLFASPSVLFFPGGVGESSPSNRSPSTTEATTVGLDPSLYSLDSAYATVDLGLGREEQSAASVSIHRTPLRSNVSSRAGSEATPAIRRKVAVVEGSVFGSLMEDEPAPFDDDEYSMLSGITAGTSATARGVKSVAKTLSAGLFSSLETPSASDNKGGGSGSFLKMKTPLFSTPVGDVPGRAKSATDGIKALTITSPAADSKPAATVNAVDAKDPSACRAWLYNADEMSKLCLGSIGKKGLVCVCDAEDCNVLKHKSHKTKLQSNTWYLLTKEDAVQIAPSLSNDVASQSNLWSMYVSGVYDSSSWSSIFNWVRSNATAASPSELVTEADSIRLLQKGGSNKTVVPKTPMLVKGPMKDSASTVPKVEFVAGVKDGFASAEATLADIYSELAKLSSKVGLPSKRSHGSCYDDIEAVSMFVSSLESTLKSAQAMLQTHHAALQKCEGNFVDIAKEGRECKQSVDKAVAHSLSASTAARDAQNVVQSFQATGTMNRVHAQGLSIDGLQKEVSFLKNQVSGSMDLLREMIAKVPSLGASTASAAQQSDIAALKREVDGLRRHTTDQMKVMKQSLEGQGPVSMGSYRFDSAEACAVQLAAWGVTTSAFEYFFDPFHLLGAVLYRSRTHKEVSEQAVLTMKTTLTASQITAIASFETSVPEIFSGASGVTALETSKLTALFASIKTYDLFDSGDGEMGVLNYVKHNLRDFLPQQHQEAESLFGTTHPGFLAFLDQMRDRSATALEALFRECGELYRNLLTRACGYCSSYTKEQKAEAWQQVLILLQVYCHEVSKVRAGARNLGNYKDPAMANSLAMWACLSALRVHDDFQRNLFREHPRISPKLTAYILTTVLRKGELASTEDKAQRAATEAQRATGTANRADTLATTVRSDLDRFISSFNSWKKTFQANEGGAEFPKKKKKKDRRNPGGQGDDGDADDGDA